MTAARAVLFLIIISFFLPFFAVSCGEQSVSLSGFDTAFGTRVEYAADIEGSPLALVLIAPSAVILILSFCRIKLYKFIFVAAPVFNIFAAVTLRFAVRAMLEKKLADYFGELNFYGLIHLFDLRMRYGFILYIILNIVLLALGGSRYFTDSEK